MGSFLEVEVFRAGDYGAKGAYRTEDLDALCSDYTLSLHEAPVTVDHAQSGPAFGWVHSLARRGEVLVATLKDLSGEFLNLIRSGAFRKRSIEIYRSFKATGRPYLRAISFLGACAPEVKGLADPVFSEQSEYEAYGFDEQSEKTTEQFAEEAGQLTKDNNDGKDNNEAEKQSNKNVVRDGGGGAGGGGAEDASSEGCAVASGEDEKVTNSEAGSDPGCLDKDDADSGDSAGHSSLREEIALLNEQKTRLQSDLAAMEEETRRERATRCCQRLIEEGRIVPAWERAGIAEFMMTLNDAPANPCAEPLREKSGLTPLEWFESFLQTLPALAPMSETAAAPSGKISFAESSLPSTGSAAPVSSASINLHQRALSLRESDARLSYAEALCQAARQA
ncbi:MAG: hypothetical protein NTX50_21170 [Candidatus Sumerlaeota bacterium]|nr:hypothetical protein [Candidatus Sumerlaeota bacterium]